MALRQDPARLSQWAAPVWPSSEGWHRLEADEAILDFYVSAADSWPSWQYQRRQWATQRAALRPRGLLPETETMVDVPVPRLPFYLVLVIGLGLLWLDERRGSPRLSTVRR